ncbi:isoprenylcysteine carboxyl methyltransferase family protein [Ureibacillus massiliensis]|uniref:isoprenylcysteine carboxyl methyltransferase family protein n=1 Tax=Ureibacillus massiliensis TaxID=292806 RepID=UPI000A07B016|nr:isoprenylcysteine carboxylmethyltransferase family protein [Ureibacillus massiliensis]
MEEFKLILFSIILTIVILQRLIELMVARKNERIMLSKGAFEAGSSHYPYMIALHVSFFLSLIIEVVLFDKEISLIFPYLFTLFIFVQLMRIWCLMSLGIFWNTKIIILPGANIVKKGPYLFMRHPNYLVVCSEILVLPLMFNAYFTAILFTLLNFLMLSVRIPTEERALIEATNYSEQFKRGFQHQDIN